MLGIIMESSMYILDVTFHKSWLKIFLKGSNTYLQDEEVWSYVPVCLDS